MKLNKIDYRIWIILAFIFGALFAIDFYISDPIPYIDETILGLLVLYSIYMTEHSS